MDAERLGRQRDLADLLRSAGLRGERRGRLQQLSPALGCDGQLEAGHEDAGDHGTERMFAYGSDGSSVIRSRSQMPPNPLDIAADGIRTLRAFGQRIPGAGDVL